MKKGGLLLGLGWLLSGAVLGQSSSSENDSVVHIGDKVVFHWVDTAGREVRSDQFKARLVLVDFWASWCPVCRTETPHLYALARQYATSKEGEIPDLVIYRVSLDDNPALLKKTLREWNTAEGVVNVWDSLSMNTPWRKRLGFLGVPHKIILDTEGRLMENDVTLQTVRLYIKAEKERPSRPWFKFLR